MRRPALVAAGAVLAVIGAVWALQGLGYLGGSPMTGSRLWAVIGPIVFVVGLVLVIRGGVRRSGGPPRV